MHARRDLAYAEINGVIYVVGGFGPAGDSLCSIDTTDTKNCGGGTENSDARGT
jgi:hypothetical protein